jgi:hypothetical protein
VEKAEGNVTIIGITGYAQNGKDSLGHMFEEIGFTKLAFADALRECVRVLNPSIPVGNRGEVWTYQDLLKAVGYEEAKKQPEVRRLLQVMGTEVARDILGENTWVEALHKKWHELEFPDLVVTDVRFPNEAAWIHRNAGFMVRVIRPLFVAEGIDHTHPSERFVPTLPVDHIVTAVDMQELEAQFRELRAVLGR